MKLKRITPVIFFAVMAIALFAYAGYKNRPSNRATPVPSATSDPTAGWKVYTNLKYHFAFKYPAGFGNQGAISGPATGTSEGLVSLTDPKTVREGTDARFDGFSVYIVTKPGTKNFDAYIKSEIAAMNKASFTSMKNPTKIKLNNGVALVSGDGAQAYYYLPNSDMSQIVVFAYLEANPSFKQTFNAVLTSFAYTE